MNLFICGWNIEEGDGDRAFDALQGMVDVYPQLDVQTACKFLGHRMLLAYMHNAAEATRPRCYMYASAEHAVLYDGCLLDRENEFFAMDAEALGAHWAELTDWIEGQYVAVRTSLSESTLEVVTDPLGMGQVYYAETGEAIWLSNSVRLLTQTVGGRGLDPLGAGLSLCMGWVGRDRTLREGVCVLPAGARWTWDATGRVEKKTHYHLSNLSSFSRKRFSRRDALSLTERLADFCRSLGRSFGELECPITGGRDSRVLVNLLAHGDTRARYYTDGIPGSDDITIAQDIASRMNLPHTIVTKNTKDLLEHWDELSHRLVAQNDGMVSLWQIADVMGQPSKVDHLGISLWGIGGEIARPVYSDPRWFNPAMSRSAAVARLCNSVLGDANGLIKPETVSACRAALSTWSAEVWEAGFVTSDLPSVFYTRERIRRWASANARKALPFTDLFAPLCTRPFVEAAFSVSALRRFSEPIHYRLLELNPLLFGFRFDKDAWRSQLPGFNVFQVVWRRIVQRLVRQAGAPPGSSAFDQRTLLEGKLGQLRSQCLDQSESPVWGLVNREQFEDITNPEGDPATRRAVADTLYQVVTLIYYA